MSTEFLEKVRKVRQAKDLSLKDCPLISPTFKPYPYQIPMIANMLMVKSMVNGDDTGLGKTPEAGCFYALRRSKEPDLNCLVVSPKNALYQWRDELKSIAPTIPSTIITTEKPSGGRWKRDPDWRMHQYQSFRSGVMVCNYHQLYKEWEIITRVLGKFIVIYDEATKFKNLKTLLHKVVKKVSEASQGCYALTATVIKGHLYEAYAVCAGMNLYPWGSQMRFDGLYPQKETKVIRIRGRRTKISVIVGWQNLDKFREEFEPYYFSRTVEEVAPYLPEVITKNLIFDMPAKNRAKYDEAVNGLFQMPDDSIKESKTLAQLHYCQLVSNSPVEMGYEGYEDSKIEAMQELLDYELEGQKVLIYSKYKRMINYLEQYFLERGETPLKVTGDVSDEDRYIAKNKFREPQYRIFLLNEAGSEAMNLQVARGILCIDLPWSYGNYKQLVGRARRQGGTQQNIMVFHLMHKDTIDEYVYEVLEEKKKLVMGATGKANEILTQSTGDFAEEVYQRMLLKREGKKSEEPSETVSVF